MSPSARISTRTWAMVWGSWCPAWGRWMNVARGRLQAPDQCLRHARSLGSTFHPAPLETRWTRHGHVTSGADVSVRAEAQLAHAALERALGDLEPPHHRIQVALALLEAAGDFLGAQVPGGADEGALVDEHV